MITMSFGEYPYLVQLHPKRMFEPYDDGRVSSIDIDLREKEITIRKVKKQKANVRIYDVEEKALNALLEFFTIEAIDAFHRISEDDLQKFRMGYRDCGYSIDYYIFCENHDPLRIDGYLNWIYENNPVEKLVQWLRETALPDLKDAQI